MLSGFYWLFQTKFNLAVLIFFSCTLFALLKFVFQYLRHAQRFYIDVMLMIYNKCSAIMSKKNLSSKKLIKTFTLTMVNRKEPMVLHHIVLTFNLIQNIKLTQNLDVFFKNKL